MTRDDLNGVLVAALVHMLLAFAMLMAPKRLHKGPQWVEVDVRKAKEVVTPPLPPPEVKAPPPPPTAPVPNQEPPKEPPKNVEPVKPIFGLTDSSTTTGDSSFSVQTGNTTIADPHAPRPKDVKPVQPLPAAPAGYAPAPVFKAASPLEITEEAQTDESACQIPDRLYPEELREQGLEGDTQLKVQIDATGKVINARILRGPHKTLDELARMWMKTHCRFKPAKSNKGPIPVEIVYTYHWEIAR